MMRAMLIAECCEPHGQKELVILPSTEGASTYNKLVQLCESCLYNSTATFCTADRREFHPKVLQSDVESSHQPQHHPIDEVVS